MPVIIVGSMTGRLTASLRRAPSTVPALAGLVLFIVWDTSQAGFPVTHWAPGGLILLALLGLTLAIVGPGLRQAPLAVKVALAALAAYTALSFLSILWAEVPGVAWEGANRTLLYLLVFALFAGWSQHGESAALLLVFWVLAMIGLALFTWFHLDAASPSALRGMIPEGRLDYPSGYPNASAAQWLMAFWPALLLARSERLNWGLRGLLAGGAVLLAEVALLSQSRGSFYSVPVMLVLVFALLPGRVRTFALLVPVAAGIGAATPSLLHVGDNLSSGAVRPSLVHTAFAVALAAAAAVAAVVALGAALESRAGLSEGTRRGVRRGVTAAAIAALLLVVGGGLVAAGNPVTRVRHAWDSFKGGYGGPSSGSRLVGGLGSNRYDFYRVALDEFVHHPVLGIGADNFAQQYLAHGRSEETPHYPHSVELRVLAETGLLGALIALVGFGASLMAGARAVRGPDPLAGTVAAAALSGFAYWVVHGSFDWFWEFAGLGAPAFALLGLACALAPRPRARVPGKEPLSEGRPVPAQERLGPAETRAPGQERAPSASARPRRRMGPVRALGAVAGGIVVLAAVCSLAAPWLSQLEVQSAAGIWTRAPATAYARLREASNLNPLSDEAFLVAGSIALRYGDLARADHEFALALGRTPGDAYATLERGAIASSRGEQRRGLSLLSAAQRLNPRDPLTRQALALARAGKRVDVGELNRVILGNALKTP
jgi:hypothetical protein